ncbi:phosphonate C-P lyase system protein PhnH [Yoonia sp. 2307UL14-13]|uniref:phosphonate C-P lyase system protein PhnH n=1 Tax=Yoonia sp. 2307UL14-13 TaxID=3126506 RepID=UPI0030B5B28E
MGMEVLSGGFADPAPDAAFAFRGIMNAMARPGRIETIVGAEGPAPLSRAAATVLMTLCDPDTALYLAPSCDSLAVREWIGFHTGAPVGPTSAAHFAVGRWHELQPLERFRTGTLEYPDRSATLIAEMDVLASEGATLRGPGIEIEARLSLPDLDAFQRNHGQFPLGLDFIFTAGDRIAALPRSTQVS